MLEKKQISMKELAQFGSVKNLSEQAKTLVAHQKSVWELAKINFNALNSIQTKTFDFGHFKIIAQFNPERIRSSAAKLDSKSIAKRPCFLCLKNLPIQQSGLVFQQKYLILANPYPIFPIHLTISHSEHIVQEIRNYFADMLEISKELPDFTVFYNGPKTGASAPDHFHFQAAIKGFMPVEKEFSNLEENHSESIFLTPNSKVIAVKNYLRKFVAIISNKPSEIIAQFEKIYAILDTTEFEEPMLNILCHFEDGKWIAIIFPREKQRPSHFFRTGKNKIVTSPASVELGGILVLPREEDFVKITKKEIQEIYEEVTINQVTFNKIITKIRVLR